MQFNEIKYSKHVNTYTETEIVKQDYGENKQYQIHSPIVKYHSKHKQTRLGFGYEAKLPKIQSNYSFRKRDNDRKYGDTVIIG